MQVDKEQYE
jgi:hypothetical protein